MSNRFARNAIVLGLLSAIGPFAIDMYLPALPTIGAELAASPAAVQMSLLAFFIAVAVCQPFYGPAADILGRRTPLFFGLALFTIGGVGSALAPSVEWLIAFRFLQGIGACAGMSIPRAIIRDLHTGPDATRLMSLMMLVFSVSPILAPLVGSAFSETMGWRSVFWAVSLAGVAGIVLVATQLPETLPAERRMRTNVRAILGSYGRLFSDRFFLGLTFIGGLGMASFFTFLANSSFVYIDHFGVTPTVYSLLFSVNAVAFIGASQFSARLSRQFGLARVIKVAVSFYLAMTAALFVVTFAGVDSLPVLVAMLFLAFGSLGLIVPSTAVLALEEHGPIAGTAAALQGFLQFVTGAAMAGIAGVLADGTQMPMVATITVCAIGAFILNWLTLRPRHEAAVQAAPAE